MRQKYFNTPFAIDGDQTVIPDPVQVSGAVSFNAGWGFDYQRQLGVDPLALPIDRTTMNWLMLAITESLQAWQQFPYPEWITTTNNDGTPYGYDYGAVVRYSATGLPPFTTYTSVLAGAGTNTSVPGADSNWRLGTLPYSFQAAGIPTGAINGSNRIYTLPQTPVGSVPVFINGLYATVGTDYSIIGATITYLGTPLGTGGLGDTIEFGEYRW
jgi:hypothetical protein